MCHGPRSAPFVLALSLAACSSGNSVVGGRDAGSAVDLGAPDIGLPDVPSPMDVPAPMDTPDVPAPMDTPDVPPADNGPPRCAADGDCVGNAGGPACDVASGRCVTCTPTSDRCPTGQYCVGATNSCTSGCRDDAACNTGGAPDGGASSSRRCDTTTHACVDCLTDEHCPSGTLCVGNLCVAGCNAGRACPASQTCCSGACVDAQSNSAHCGVCERRCMVANAVPLCLNGGCAIVTCVAPYGDCDGLPANGCEVDTSRDVAHCGGCGMACETRPNTVTTCAGGACAYACAAGFANCDGDPSNGCEADTRASTTHCGGCGVRCAPVNATAACVAGACGYTACALGYGDCDGNMPNGCEADLPVSVSHCGACGNRCPATANAAPVCVGGACGTVCTAGFADCDSNAANGCEVDTRTDVAHCGGCGRRCGAAGGAPTCVAGGCSLACAAGFADCDSNATNGCEVDTRVSRAHCGGCGIMCDANAACTGSCMCNPGYMGSGLVCTDVDECLVGNGGCDANATCRNSIGSRTCMCNEAFTGDGLTCAPVIIELTIAASTTAYNVFLQAGAPMIPRVVRVTVNPGVVVSSTSTGVPALISGGLRAGSELRIVNRGTITGAGGAGGAGGGFSGAGPNPQSAGGAGGAAISTTTRLVIDNTAGNIWGGGGGGGGGGVATITNVLAGGGGGGGGAGTTAGGGGAAGPAFSGAQYPVGYVGVAGTASAGGAGGAGGDSGVYSDQNAGGYGFGGPGGAGGGPGQVGGRGVDGRFRTGALGGLGMAGGAAGNAIVLNGNTVTFSGGNNSTQVRGPVN